VEQPLQFLALLADGKQQGLGSTQVPCFFKPKLSGARGARHRGSGGMGMQALGKISKRAPQQQLRFLCRQWGGQLL
jgi:hypothetical protein